MTERARRAGAARRGGRAGFTLLEMMVAIAILSVVMLAVFRTMTHTSDLAAVEAQQNDLEKAGQKMLEEMSAALRSASVISISSDGTRIVFQVPVDLDGNGTVLDGSGNVEFGAQEGGVVTDDTITYRFVQDVVGAQPDMLSEGLLRRDINRDGDLLDRFDRGFLGRITSAPGAALRECAGVWVVQPTANYGGDVDGDGSADPIFRMANERLWIDLWLASVDRTGMVHFVHCNTSVFLRNH